MITIIIIETITLLGLIAIILFSGDKSRADIELLQGGIDDPEFIIVKVENKYHVAYRNKNGGVLFSRFHYMPAITINIDQHFSNTSPLWSSGRDSVKEAASLFNDVVRRYYKIQEGHDIVATSRPMAEKLELITPIIKDRFA